MKKLILAKTLSWYFFHFIMVTMLGTLITSEFDTGIKIASAEMLAETFIFYIHENIWHKAGVKWNSHKH